MRLLEQSLRLRLAVMYSLLALALLALVGGLTLTVLVRELDRQFVSRLAEQADARAEAFAGALQRLGQTTATPGAYTMLVRQDGQIVATSPALRDFQDTPFAQLQIPRDGRAYIGELPLRATTRPWELFGQEQGFVWVALPEDTLISSKQSAVSVLTVGLLLGPLLLLLATLWVGRRELRGLERAAAAARALPAQGSAEGIPLPARKDEVHRLVQAINGLLGRIDLQQQREKQLLGQIVHELGAPLTVIRAALDRSPARHTDPAVAQAALVAEELNFTTQDLMQLARGNTEMQLAYHLIPARELQARLSRLVSVGEFTGDWDTPVLCDPDRLTQALRNLLANARRAAGPQGQVTAHLEAGPSELAFHVTDSGPGLPPGIDVFAPFVSGSGSSGLGLSVARQIAQAHGGDLTGRSDPGGAHFTLTLPAALMGDDEEEG